MARLLKIDLAGNIEWFNFATQRRLLLNTIRECYFHSTLIPLKIRLGHPSVVLVSSLIPSPQPLFSFTKNQRHMPQSTSDLLKEIELLRQINAIQQQTIDSLTKSQQNILNNLLRKDNRVTSFPVKIILN